MYKIENILNKNINEFFNDEDLDPLDEHQVKVSINKLEENKSIIEIDNISMPEIEKEIILTSPADDKAEKDNWLKDKFFNEDNYDLIKDVEYKNQNFIINLFSEEENIYLDVGGNEDGSKGFIFLHTLAFDEDSNEYINIDIKELQNGSDFRGSFISVNKLWISEWDGKDSLRFDLKYIDSSGKEFVDHYYYNSINGVSNKASEERFAGESDLFLFKNFDKESDNKDYIFPNNNELRNENEIFNIGLSTNYLVHDQLERKFILYIPSSYKSDSNYPLLLNFHGGSSTALGQLNIADMRKLSDDN